MRFSRPRRVPAAFLFTLLAGLACGSLAAPGPASAQDSAYVVGNVAVDATAETAALARDQAIAEAQSRALQQLFERLVVAEDLPRLPPPSPQLVTGLLQDFSVADERSSAQRYLADFTVRFRPAAVRQLIQQYGLRFADAVARPVLVLPVLDGTPPRLWEDPNPWSLAWTRYAAAPGLVPAQVPLGDLSDMGAVTAEQALAGDSGPLGALAERYGAREILVAEASLSGDPEQGSAQVRVSSRYGAPASLSAGPAGGYEQQPDETLDRLLLRAVTATMAPLEAAWKAQNVLDFSTRSTARVTAVFANPGDFAEIRRRMESVPSIVGSSVARLKRGEAELQVTFLGSQEQLAAALSQRDLILTRQLAAFSGSGAATTAGGFGVAPQGSAYQIRLGSGGVMGDGGEAAGDGFVERLGDDAAPGGEATPGQSPDVLPEAGDQSGGSLIQ